MAGRSVGGRANAAKGGPVMLTDQQRILRDLVHELGADKPCPDVIADLCGQARDSLAASGVDVECRLCSGEMDAEGKCLEC